MVCTHRHTQKQLFSTRPNCNYDRHGKLFCVPDSLCNSSISNIHLWAVVHACLCTPASCNISSLEHSLCFKVKGNCFFTNEAFLELKQNYSYRGLMTESIRIETQGILFSLLICFFLLQVRYDDCLYFSLSLTFKLTESLFPIN